MCGALFTRLFDFQCHVRTIHRRPRTTFIDCNPLFEAPSEVQHDSGRPRRTAELLGGQAHVESAHVARWRRQSLPSVSSLAQSSPSLCVRSPANSIDPPGSPATPTVSDGAPSSASAFARMGRQTSSSSPGRVSVASLCWSNEGLERQANSPIPPHQSIGTTPQPRKTPTESPYASEAPASTESQAGPDERYTLPDDGQDESTMPPRNRRPRAATNI